MRQKVNKDERGVSPVVGVILMVLITIFLAATIGYLVDENHYYKIQIEEISNTDFLLVKALNYTNNSPLPNVTIKALEHGGGRSLLSGPRTTDESGYAKITIPDGYDEHFDIVGEYKSVIITKTIDKRSPFVKLDEYLGPLGTGLLIAIVALVGGRGWFLRKSRNKKAPEENSSPSADENAKT